MSEHEFLILILDLIDRLHPGRRIAHANSTTTNSGSQISCLERGLNRALELLIPVNGSQPVGVAGRVVVAASLAVALNEGARPEISEARSRRHEALSRTLRARVRVHDEAVSDPKLLPVLWAHWDVHGLAVHGHHAGWGLADGAL